MTDYNHDISRYLSGAMTPQERHAFEKKVLADPFLAEALEGAEQLSAAQFKEDVEALNKTILTADIDYKKSTVFDSQKVAAEVASLNRKKGKDIKQIQVSIFRWTLRIAAGLVILLVSGYLIWLYVQPVEKQNTLAMEQSDSLPPSTLQDSIVDKDKLGQQRFAESFVETNPENTDRTDNVSSSPTKNPETADDDLEEKRKESKPTEQKAVSGQHIAEINPAVNTPKPDEIVRAKIAVEEENTRLAEATQRETNDVAKKQAAGRVAETPTTGSIIIRGRVTSADDGTPLPGVNILVKGTTTGTVSRADGSYQLNTAVTNPVLVYSFIGMKTTEVEPGVRNEVDISMSFDELGLSEMAISGYGIPRNNESNPPVVMLAHPENGNRKFRQYLEKSIRYPDEAKAQKIEGRVTVDFFVEPDGTLTGFTIIRGIGGGCDQELIRLIKEGPKWIPTMHDSIPVRDKVRVRLKFELPK